MFLNTTKKKFQVLKCVATREKNFKKNREKKDTFKLFSSESPLWWGELYRENETKVPPQKTTHKFAKNMSKVNFKRKWRGKNSFR